MGKHLYLFNLETVDINDPRGKKWYRHQTESRLMTEAEAAAKAQKLIAEVVEHDPTFGGLIACRKPKDVRVQVRKVTVVEDTYVRYKK